MECVGEVAAKRNGQLERLPDVAKVGLSLARELGRIDLRERLHERTHAVSPLVARREPEGREDTGGSRDEHPLDAELVCQRAGMQRPGAPECDERELARVVTALHRDDAHRAQHLGVHHVDHRRGIDAVERELCRLAIEHEPTWQLGRQPAEQEVRVGDRRAAACAVARRPRMRTRRFRPDADRPAGVPAHERAAARPDRVEVDRRQADGKAADDALRDACGSTSREQADVGRRAAHVERDRVLERRASRDEPGADDSACRAGDQDRRRMCGGLVDRGNATRGEHHERLRKSRLVSGSRERAEVAADDRREICIGSGRRRALVLAELRRDLVRRNDVHPRMPRPQLLRDCALM